MFFYSHFVMPAVQATWCALLLGGSIYLVERRGRQQPLDPKRQVEIATLLESIPEAAAIIDANHRIVEANTAVAQLVGVPREQLIGRSAEEVGRVLADTGEQGGQSAETILNSALSGHVVRHERRLLRNPQNGAVSELLVSANPIRKQNGEPPIAALIIARDVTELTQLQRRRGDMERHRAIGQMAAALAHDFNNILATISQAAALLEIKANEPPADRKVLLDMIQNTVRRGAEIIARVREYLRTGSGALSKVNVRQVIEEAVELTKPLWQKANITLVSHLDPAAKARTNAADLRRVFTNLIINSIEAMPRGGQITVTCELRNDRVLASVSDTGVGIPPEQQKKIFFAYFTTKERGTGLGLSGAQKILLAQGGHISFQSQPGQGTTFTITLPAAPREQPSSKEPAA